jgi:hypothetical protein
VFITQDGKSSLDLARELGRSEVLEALNMQPTSSSGSDPFISALSGYMQERERESRNKNVRN